ncbi:CHRD domain-containing protein [Gloeobacter violaceus]|nr:CHRD domain-containing protein [Gloeobacter violaceus]
MVTLGALAALTVGAHPAFAETPTLSAILLGGNEVSSTGQANAGDQDGIGFIHVRIDPAKGQACYSLRVDNLGKPTVFHIHNAKAGVNGSVVVDLVPPDSADPGSINKCVPADPAVAEQILNQPLEFYVNFHTEEFPDGALRGQLFYRRF